jgi:hypothetical protein
LVEKNFISPYKKRRLFTFKLLSLFEAEIRKESRFRGFESFDFYLLFTIYFLLFIMIILVGIECESYEADFEEYRGKLKALRTMMMCYENNEVPPLYRNVFI